MGGVAVAGLAAVGPDAATVALNPFLLEGWRPPGGRDWLTMGVLAAVTITGSIFAAVAYQNAPSPVVATFDYSYLAFSALWGLLIFAETPDAPAVLGMIMIVAAGLMVLRS